MVILSFLYIYLWFSVYIFQDGSGYSDGENYAFLEQQNITSYIPPHGTYKGGPDDFVYHKEQGYYTYPQGNVVPFKKIFYDYRTGSKKKNTESHR